MSNSISRIAAGVIGLTVLALPHLAAAQTYDDGPPPYRPDIREEYRPANDGWDYEPRHLYRPDDRRAAFDADDRPRPRHHHRYFDDVRDYPGYDVPAYGRPGHGSRYDRPVGLPLDDGYRPVAVAVPLSPVYGGGPRRVGPDLGCTVQSTERDGYGGRETVTRRSCYAR